ncbi:uncharacterized protein LOC130645416 [Hydractinia symbiolongicarpus]|uniref:uncharacterized protein LOC130645416 n=1 Tax=Hydractinia symbiolongicarpus TaxID=13093 RepID=UPI00254FA23F|nr:uncharacterized protein LOC130645416 [Hydractinia symbiolongicarpus]
MNMSRSFVVNAIKEDDVKVHAMKGDGHCLLYAKEFAMQMKGVSAIPSIQGIIDMIRFELLKNIDFYAEFIRDIDILHQFDEYAHETRYDSDIVDLVLLFA